METCGEVKGARASMLVTLGTLLWQARGQLTLTSRRYIGLGSSPRPSAVAAAAVVVGGQGKRKNKSR